MKMKKLLGLGLAAVLSLSMVACSGGGEDASSANKLDQIKENGKVVIAVSADYPPFEFHSTANGSDEVVGVDIDLAKAIAEEAGVEVEVKEMAFSGLVDSLKSDKVDMVISGMSPTPEREEQVDFSDVYYTGHNVLVVREGEEDKVKSDEDVKNMKVAVQKGSLQENYVTNLGCTSIKSLEAIPDTMMELKNGNVDAVIVNDTVGMINTNQIDGIALSTYVLPDSDVEESMAVAVNKGENAEFLELINKAVADFKDNALQKSLEDNSALAAE